MSSSRINAGPWAGGVTDTAATVKASVMRGVTAARLLVSEDPALPEGGATAAHAAELLWTDPEKDYKEKIARFELRGLRPDTEYHYLLELNGRREEAGTAGRLRTFPSAGTRAGFRFALGSCSNSLGVWNLFRGNPWVYEAVAREPDLLFFFHLGDLHYGNVAGEEVAERLARYDSFLLREEPRGLFRRLPVAYCWDDHDFLGNNAEGGDEDKRVAARFARDAYDVYVPHYPFANGTDGIYQSFVVGRVLFLLTDTRFNKSPRKGSGTSGKTMLGANQKAWLKGRLLTAGQYDLVVWANSVPWIGEAEPKEDFWAGYADERRELAQFVKDNAVRNLCMVSGDAHMLAIDDGSHAGFAASGGGGFPVFHAAALESRPSQKGGLYSVGDDDGTEGAGLPGTGQYGVFEVRYAPGAAGPPHVYWEGRRAAEGAAGGPPASRMVIAHDFPAARTYAAF